MCYFYTESGQQGPGAAEVQVWRAGLHALQLAVPGQPAAGRELAGVRVQHVPSSRLQPQRGQNRLPAHQEPAPVSCCWCNISITKSFY